MPTSTIYQSNRQQIGNINDASFNQRLPGAGAPAEGPLAALTNNPIPGNYRPTKFPGNIAVVDNFITIGAYKEHVFPASGATRAEGQKAIVESVILPIPSNLATSYAQQYNDGAALGPIGAAIGQAVGPNARNLVEGLANVVGNEATVKQGQQKISTAASGMIENVNKDINLAGVALSAGISAVEGFAPLAAGSLANLPGVAIGDQLSKGIQATEAVAGVARNPHLAVLYETPNFRAFNFSWELRPKDFIESLSINRIIRFFKYYSSPGFANSSKFGNNIFEYPSQFSIKTKYDELTHTYGDCVLKNFSVDYHGEGTPLYYDASNQTGFADKKMKAPAVVKISCDFQEVTIVTRETIEGANR